MTAHIGQCGLCLEMKELQDSHLIMASAYKLVRDSPGGANPNPVVVSRQNSFLTSRQASALFLCSKCEQRFNESGENYVITQCRQINGQFDLRKLLQAEVPLGNTHPVKGYDVQPLLGNKVAQYLYFAASVFWRASARQWKIGTALLDRISLGPTYQEQFRLYLLGKATFPQNARMWVCVSNEDELHRMIVPPYTNKIDGVHRHDFYIPGIRFILFLGQVAPQQFDNGALNGSLRQMMWLSPWLDDPVFLGAVNLTKVSVPSGKLRK